MGLELLVFGVPHEAQVKDRLNILPASFRTEVLKVCLSVTTKSVVKLGDRLRPTDVKLASNPKKSIFFRKHVKNNRFFLGIISKIYLQQTCSIETVPASNAAQKTTGQRIFTLMNVFNIRIHGACPNFDRNCIKTLKIGKLWGFCHFRFQFEIFFIWKTAISSWEKPTEHRICAMLSVFNTLIQDIYPKKIKECIWKVHFFNRLCSHPLLSQPLGLVISWITGKQVFVGSNLMLTLNVFFCACQKDPYGFKAFFYHCAIFLQIFYQTVSSY